MEDLLLEEHLVEDVHQQDLLEYLVEVVHQQLLAPVLVYLWFSLKLVHELLSPGISSFTIFHASNLV